MFRVYYLSIYLSIYLSEQVVASGIGESNRTCAHASAPRKFRAASASPLRQLLLLLAVVSCSAAAARSTSAPRRVENDTYYLPTDTSAAACFGLRGEGRCSRAIASATWA